MERRFGLSAVGAIPFALLGTLVASCSPRPLDWSPDPAAETAPTSTPGLSSPTTPEERQAWRRAMSKVPLPGNGCYVATQATSAWQEMPCLPPLDMHFDPGVVSGGPIRESVGGHLGKGVDYESKTVNPISWAEGSFAVVNNVTSVTDNMFGNGFYSLQLNSNRFSAPTLCAGADPSVRASCQGWQQFIFRNDGKLLIEYWLLPYNTFSCSTNCCPSVWSPYHDSMLNVTDCSLNSPTVSTPFEPITDLGNLTLLGVAGGGDSALLSTGNDTIYALGEDSVLGLSNGGWTSAEFNIFGYGNGSGLTFNDANVSMVVQTFTNTTPASGPPSCLLQTETGETNSLDLNTSSCCQVGGSFPHIEFLQSNNHAGAYLCPLSESQVQLPVAFQANTHFLWFDQNGIGANQNFAMKSGSVPSLVTIPGGVAVGFQGSNGHFWLDQAGTGTDSSRAMQGATSPSIARLKSGQIAVAFQGSNGHLWVGTNGATSAVDTTFAMKAGTNPSIAATQNGLYAVGFQGSNGHFWLDQSGAATDSGKAMQGTSSPSIAVWPDDNDTIFVSFQGSNGHLWVGPNGVLSAFDAGVAMKANTSPSAAIMVNGAYYAVAFQGSNSDLWLDYAGAASDAGFGMNATASPILMAMPDTGYQIAFKANTSNLWIDMNGGGFDQGLGMN